MHTCLTVPEGTFSSLKTSVDVKTRVRFFALHRVNHMLHRLCGPRHLSFNLRPYSPGRSLNALARKPRLRAQPQVTSFTAWTTVSNPVCSHAFAPERQSLSRVPSPPVFSRSLRISPRYTRNSTPLQDSKACQFRMRFGLSRGFHIRLDRPPACALRPVIPINSHPPYYRGCWHEG